MKKLFTAAIAAAIILCGLFAILALSLIGVVKLGVALLLLNLVNNVFGLTEL